MSCSVDKVRVKALWTELYFLNKRSSELHGGLNKLGAACWIVGKVILIQIFVVLVQCWKMNTYPALIKLLWWSEEYFSSHFIWSSTITFLLGRSSASIATLIIHDLSMLPHLLDLVQDGLHPDLIITLDFDQLIQD